VPTILVRIYGLERIIYIAKLVVHSAIANVKWMPMTTRKSHKQRGATFETALRDWFRTKLFNAERLARTGKNDEGDVYVQGNHYSFVLEAKAPGASNRIDLSGWLKEAEVEAANYAKHRNLSEAPRPIVVIKARGKSIDDAYVVIRLKDYPW
jgi:hypothetical protein